jgi:hypothetical protein
MTTDQSLEEMVEHQREQIELLKQQLIETGKERDVQEAWVRRHENHLGEVRIKLTHIFASKDTEKVKAAKAWLLDEAYRDDYDVE